MPKYGNIVPAVKRFGHTLLCMIITIVITMYIDINYMLTPEFAERHILFKTAFLIAAMHIKIYSLYVCFGSIESNMIAAGFSYTPKSEK